VNGLPALFKDKKIGASLALALGAGLLFWLFSGDDHAVPVTVHLASSPAQAQAMPLPTGPSDASRTDSVSVLPASFIPPSAGSGGSGGALAGLDCLIEPHLTVEVATSASGILKDIRVDRGYLVKKGEVLATLENEVEKANVAHARARVEFAKKKYKRMVELQKEQMVSMQQLDEAKAENDLAEAEYQKAAELLRQRTITSPLSGVVVEKFVSVGEMVENKKIVKVAQVDPLNVEIIAPVSMLGGFNVGANVLVFPEGPVPGPLNAAVKLVDRVIDAPSGTFRVRLEMPNAKSEISAGVRCRAKLADPDENAKSTEARLDPEAKMPVGPVDTGTKPSVGNSPSQPGPVAAPVKTIDKPNRKTTAPPVKGKRANVTTTRASVAPTKVTPSTNGNLMGPDFNEAGGETAARPKAPENTLPKNSPPATANKQPTITQASGKVGPEVDAAELAAPSDGPAPVLRQVGPRPENWPQKESFIPEAPFE